MAGFGVRLTLHIGRSIHHGTDRISQHACRPAFYCHVDHRFFFCLISGVFPPLSIRPIADADLLQCAGARLSSCTRAFPSALIGLVQYGGGFIVHLVWTVTPLFENYHIMFV